MFGLLLEDFRFKAHCFYGHSKGLSLLKVFMSDGSSAMVLYRLQQFCVRWYLSPLAWIFIWLNKLINGCVIGSRASFEGGFVIMHGQGVVINGACRGGRRIVIESGVVLGAKNNGVPVLAPRLENGVFIGSGAKVLGGVTIGEDAIIGANAVVLNDVPAGQTAVGIPSKCIVPAGSKK